MRVTPLFLLVVTLVTRLTPVAEARSCYSAGIPSSMQALVTSLESRWTPLNAVNIGISELFSQTGSCSGCHNPDGPYVNAYTSCGGCHNDAVTEKKGAYPAWLNFTIKENLMRTSYYYPGATKAEASLQRVLDGTMPPGARPQSVTIQSDGEDRATAWCDEIKDKYQAWIAAGFP